MPDASTRCRAPRRLRAGALVCAAAFASSVVATGLISPAAPVAAASVVDVVAWAPYWEVNDALASFNARPATFAEVTPFFWSATSATTIALNSQGGAKLAAYKQAAAANGKPIVGTITDGLPAHAMAAVLGDPTTRTQHVNAIVQMVTSNGLSGADIDYEHFAFGDGRDDWPTTYEAWGAFLTELGASLHANGKTLAVAVPPIYDNGKTSNSGYWVYNYPVMAQVVDRIRIMTYSYSGSAAGPIAPYDWVGKSMSAALAVPGMAAGKVVMGLAAFGNDAITKIDGSCPKGTVLKSRSMTHASAAQFAADRGATPTWNATYHERTFKYVESYTGPDSSAVGATVRCNVSRTVYYEDEQAVYERVLLAQSKGIGGVALWALGYDTDLTWQAIAAAKANTGFTQPDPLPPAIKAPAVNAPYPSIIVSSGPLPARYVDTRTGGKTADGLLAGGGRLEADGVLEVQIGGRGPVPGNAAAVTLNVTVLGAGTGYVTVYPCGDQPDTSSLNVKAGQTISNSVITRLSSDGKVCIYSQQPADIVVDVFNVLPASTFVPLATPVRLLDTRPGYPTTDGQLGGGGAMARDGVLQVQVAGRSGLSPATKTAVLNVTAVGAVGNGYLTVWPCGQPQPATSNVNFTPGAAIPNAVVTALGADGTACIYASNGTHVIVDAFGQLAAGQYSPLAQPARLMESRKGYATADGAFNAMGKFDAGSTMEIQVATRVGLGASPGAVVLNVTVDQPELAGYVTVYPCGSARPAVSNVNFAPNQTLPNLVVSQLSATGTICVYSHVEAHVIVDVFGSLTL